MLTRSSSSKNRFAISSRKKCCKYKCDHLKPNNTIIKEELPLSNKRNSKYYNQSGVFKRTLYNDDVYYIKNNNIEIKKRMVC